MLLYMLLYMTKFAPLALSNLHPATASPATDAHLTKSQTVNHLLEGLWGIFPRGGPREKFPTDPQVQVQYIHTKPLFKTSQHGLHVCTKLAAQSHFPNDHESPPRQTPLAFSSFHVSTGQLTHFD
jgi:hypothetical protein